MSIRLVIVIPTNRPAAEVTPTVLSCKAVVPDEQIIVVDNLRNRTLADIAALETVAARCSNARLIRDLNPGLLTGRMRGAVESDSDIVVYLDDDVCLGADWLEGVQAGFADPSVVLVGGPSEPVWEGDVPDWLHGFVQYRNSRVAECAWLSLLDFGTDRRPLDPNYVWGLNFAIRRSVLEECGGFHPDCMPDNLQHFQGDGESGLTRKIAARGLKARYEPRMRVKHRIGPNRMTPEYFYRRAFYQGVCDSYSKLRVAEGVDTQTISNSDDRWLGPLRDKAGGLWDRCASALKTFQVGGEFPGVKRGTDRAYRAGYEFHRIAVDSCPAVRRWALKSDYWDYRLPASDFDAAAVRRECLTRYAVPAVW